MPSFTVYLLCLVMHTQCVCIGSSDFDFSSHFEVKQPIPDTLRAQGFGNWQKNFSTSSMACGNFWQKPENAFFWSSFKV